MDKPDRNDQQIRQVFSAARRVDRETLPGYRAVRDAEPRAARRRPARRRLTLTLGFAGTVASVALALIVFKLAPEPTPVPQPVTSMKPASTPENAEQTPLPVAVAQRAEPAASSEENDPGTRRALKSLESGKGAEGEHKGTPAGEDDVTAVRPPNARPSVDAPSPKPPLPSPKPPSPSPPAGLDVLAATEALRPAPESPQVPTPMKLEAAQLTESVRVVADRERNELEATSSATRFNDEFVVDLPVPGRFYQNASTVAAIASGGEVSGSRGRDFKATVGGVGFVAANVPQGVAISSYAQAAAQTLEIPLDEGANREAYDLVVEQDFVATVDEALSTFSIDVDKASYANIRRYLRTGKLPPRDAVRIEEMINYFDYDYPEPSGGEPFSTTVDIAGCPWNPEHRLARIGIKGRNVHRAETRGSNLVFLIDVSGSMRQANKLPLLKSAFALLVGQLDARDQVAIVVYAGASGLVLESTSGADQASILAAVNRLEAGGSTNGGAGLELAYRIARENFLPGGVNRVVLATDGDFNVGHTSGSDLLELIKQDASAGISLTALGFGMGNLNDATLETLADRGDGNYFYIDTQREARKVLVEELQGTLVTIAKDVKIQVEFNPAEVEAYRLIGYENRALAKQDFNDDKKDAGEIGSGHTVTALYEIVPAGSGGSLPAVDPLKYQRSVELSREAASGELFSLKVRYKEPEESTSRLLQFAARDDGRSFSKAADDFRFAAAVAAFGMVLRDSAHRGAMDLDTVAEMLSRGVGSDKSGHRAEFYTLVRAAREVPQR